MLKVLEQDYSKSPIVFLEIRLDPPENPRDIINSSQSTSSQGQSPNRYKRSITHFLNVFMFYNERRNVNDVRAHVSLTEGMLSFRSVSGKKLCSTCGIPLGKGAAMIIETLSLYFHIQCFKVQCFI